ncbi:MAG: MFS transporter [Thermodesulfobacteriota bacterium]
MHGKTTDNHGLERSVLTVATVTSFLGPFMLSAVNVALPVIQKDLAANAVELSWIATSYLLATAVCLVPIGRIADIHGRRRFFILGLIVFTVSNFLTFFVRDIGPFIVLRVLQGAGAAMTVTTGMAIVTSVFPSQRRGKAIGIYVAAVYVGLSAGPFGGGVLAQHFGWRSIFVVTTAIGMLSALVAFRGLRGNEWADAAGEPMDIIGSLLYGVSLILLVYGATLLPAWSAAVMVTAGLLLLFIFIRYELKLKHPVFEIHLFSDNRMFAFSSTAALIHYAATFAVTFLLSLYLQYIKGMSPQAAGTLLVAQPVCMAVFSPLAGKISDRVEPWKIASAGMAMTAVSLAALVMVNASTPFYVIVGILITLGTGFALFSSPNMSAIMGAVAPRYYGTASGTVATMRLVGQMVSMALVTVVFTVIIGKVALSPDNYDQFLFCMHFCLIVFTALCIVGVVFSLYRGTMRQD